VKIEKVNGPIKIFMTDDSCFKAKNFIGKFQEFSFII